MKKIIILLCILLSACDPGGFHMINGKKDLQAFSQCGDLDLTSGWFTEFNHLNINYHIKDTILINPDSITFLIGNYKAEVSISNSFKARPDTFLKFNCLTKLSDWGTLSVNFRSGGILRKKDTVKVLAKGFIKCGNQSLLPDSFNLTNDYTPLFLHY